MKILGLNIAATILLLNYPVLAQQIDLDDFNEMGSQTVNVQQYPDGEQVQLTSISINRADLRQPHMLRVRSEINNSAMRMERVEVKMNGRLLKSIANNALELNLAPMMTVGRYEVEVSGISPPDATISLNFTGPNTQVNQQSSGSGKINQRLMIDVR